MRRAKPRQKNRSRRPGANRRPRPRRSKRLIMNRICGEKISEKTVAPGRYSPYGTVACRREDDSGSCECVLGLHGLRDGDHPRPSGRPAHPRRRRLEPSRLAGGVWRQGRLPDYSQSQAPTAGGAGRIPLPPVRSRRARFCPPHAAPKSSCFASCAAYADKMCALGVSLCRVNERPPHVRNSQFTGSNVASPRAAVTMIPWAINSNWQTSCSR